MTEQTPTTATAQDSEQPKRDHLDEYLAAIDRTLAKMAAAVGLDPSFLRD